jgi:hypothetical protein
LSRWIGGVFIAIVAAVPAPATPNAGVVDLPKRDPRKPWPASCLVHRGCNVAVRKLEPCARETTARSWTEIAVAPDVMAGTKVSARGPLVLGPITHKGILCTADDPKTGKPIPICCPGAPTSTANMFIGDGPPRLALPDHVCRGDMSRLCCNVDSLGQVVVATGRLEAVAGTDPLIGLAQWKLAGDLTLCVDAAAHAPERR